MRDVVERAEEYLKVFDEHPERYLGARGIVRELVAALRRERAKSERLQQGSHSMRRQ